MKTLLSTAAVLLSLAALTGVAHADTLQDSVNASIAQRLKAIPAPAQVTPHITFNPNTMTSDQRAGFVMALYIHSKICTTSQPDILVQMSSAIMNQAPPDSSDLARHLESMQADASRGPGEWCRTVTASFKTFVE
jgi:hypothetical protein